MSIARTAEPVTGLDLLMDAAGYGAVAGLAQTLSHKTFAKKQLPETWEELVLRYVAGSTINALVCSAWALHRPQATGREAAALHWLVLVASGLVVASLHYFDSELEKEAMKRGQELGAEAMRRKYQEQEHARSAEAAERLRRAPGA